MDENGSTPIQSKAKMSGYLEKKSKMRMVSSWKKYWFVLQDRLLLFYRSKDEYEAISACKGSINLGPPCTIKSYPSVQHAFQIVTRATSFTLRAENAVDQKKWMQTIMFALNQANSHTPSQANQPPSSTAAHHQQRLSHFRYSLDDLVPEIEPAKNFDRANSDLISRIQRMGGISYGGSLGTIAHQIGPQVISLPEHRKHNHQQTQVTTVRKNKSLSDENFVSSISRIEDHYERISSDSFNDGGGGGRGATTSLYERIPYDLIPASSCERVQSLIIDNDNYSVPVKKTQSFQDNNRDSAKSFIIENAIYGEGERDKRVCQRDEEAIYAEPHKHSPLDHNENDLLIENSIYHLSSPTKTNTNGNSNNNNRKQHHENLYECVDEDLYCIPAEEVLQSKNAKKSKKKTDAEEKPAKVKKSRSFMKRLLSKKTDSRKSKQQEQNNSEREQLDDRSGESAIYDEIDPKGLEKFAMNDTSAMQMLTELASILEAKKPVLIKSLTDPPMSNAMLPSSDPSDKLNASPPLLPLKLGKQNNNDISPSGTVYSKWASDDEQPRSLDEILEDLDRDSLNPQPEPKNKIKRLIEKFDGENNVILRNKRRNGRNFNSRYSDELDYLLDELAKITSAPIMAPGATNSLMDPTLHDEQWLRLIPKRQRRLSEPDYDVPRPLKFEKSPDKPQTEEKKDESLNFSMTPDSLEVDTPKIIIKEYCYDAHFQNECNKGLAQDLKCFSQRYKNENNNNNNNNSIYAVPKSYVSVATHIVNTCQNICSSELMADEEHTIIYKTVKNIITESDEVFTDSLELNESLTKF